MGKSERGALRSQLARLIAHLLIWRYQPESRRISENSWRATVLDTRRCVRELWMKVRASGLNYRNCFQPLMSTR